MLLMSATNVRTYVTVFDLCFIPYRRIHLEALSTYMIRLTDLPMDALLGLTRSICIVSIGFPARDFVPRDIPARTSFGSKHPQHGGSTPEKVKQCC